MTLVLVAMNQRQVVLVSDRRLSAGGRAITDESGKSCALETEDGRFLVAYAGLARVGSFDFFRWMLLALSDCGPPDFSSQGLVQRFVERLNDLFDAQPALKSLPDESRHLEVIFAGYRYTYDPPMASVAFVSNKPQKVGDKEYRMDDGKFFAVYEREIVGEDGKRPPDFTYVQRLGWWPALRMRDVEQLRSLISRNPPVAKIARASQRLMRAIAARPESSQTIGGQVDTIILSRDIQQPITSQYSVANTTRGTFMPAMVWATQRSNAVVHSVSIEPVDPRALPMSVPVVGRNHPCPCGGGKKYKHCHGRS